MTLPVLSPAFALADGRFFQVSGLRWQLHYWLKPYNNAGPDHVRSIMPYVDVVFTPRRDAIIFDYSGYTLSQYKRYTVGWQPEDYRHFHTWLESADTLDYLEAVFSAVREFARQQHRDFDVAELPCYAHLADYLDASRQKVATVRQWQETLDKAPGLRPEEIRFSGLEALWGRHAAQDRLPREALFDALDFSVCQPVLVSEAVRDFRVSSRYISMARLVRRRGGHLPKPPNYGIERYRHASMGYRILLNRYRDLAPQEPVWIATDEMWRQLSLLRHDGKRTRFQTLEEAKASIEADIDRRFRGYGHYFPLTKWDDYVVPGGEDYREHFLVLANWPANYLGPHFDLPNILVHLRTTLRTDITGRRLLFLEELQSDWHQRGKRFGYDGDGQDSPPFAPFAGEWAELGLKVLLWWAVRKGMDSLAWTSGQLQEMRYRCSRPGLVTFYDKTLPKVLRKLVPWGCTLGATAIQTKRLPGEVHHEYDRWCVRDEAGERISRYFHTPEQAEAWQWKRAVDVTVTVPLLTLSDGLKTHLRQRGLPLYGWFMQ